MGFIYDYAPLDDISNRLAIPSLIFAFLTPLFVAARCAFSKLRAKGLGLDDYLIIMSATLAVPGTVLMIVASSWGFGKHERDLLSYPPEELPFGDGKILIEKTLQLFFADQIIYSIVMGLFKVAVLVWYTRIFTTPNKKKFRWICYGLACAIAAFTVASVFATVFQCDPIDVAWRKHPPQAKCFNTQAYWDFRAYFNVITYFLVTFLPMPSIFGVPPFIDGVHMTRAEKASTCALFGMGIFVSITSVLRMQAIGLAALQKDRTWNAVDLCMWSIIEDNVGIICVCLPSIAKPFTVWLRTICGYPPPPPKSRSSSRSTGVLLNAASVVEKGCIGKTHSPTESSDFSEEQSV